MSETLKWAWEAESAVIPRTTRYDSSAPGGRRKDQALKEIALWFFSIYFSKKSNIYIRVMSEK